MFSLDSLDNWFVHSSFGIDQRHKTDKSMIAEMTYKYQQHNRHNLFELELVDSVLVDKLSKWLIHSMM